MTGRKAFLMGAIVTAAGALIGGFGSRMMKAQSAAGHAAFTAQVVDTVYKPTGELVYTTTVAMMSNGSNVKLRSRTAPNGQPYQIKRVFDTTNKLNVIVDDLAHTVSTMPISDAYLSAVTKLPTCTGDPGTESSQILGYTVVQTTQQLPMQAGIAKSVRWLAPELNCFALKEIHYPPNSQTIASTTVVQSISLGEPDPALLQIPTGYIESPPSQQIAQHAQMLGREDSNTSSNCPTCNGGVLDKIYNARRSGVTQAPK